MNQFPKSRKHKLVVQEFQNELLIYDKERHRAHCLNEMAASIWRHCDGQTSIADIAKRVPKDLKSAPTVDERVVWYALKQLNRDHLLEQEISVPSDVLQTFGGRLNRRSMMQALGLTAIVALPLVTSMASPNSVDATSCLPPGSTCSTGVQCCNGLCNSNTCN